MGAQNVLASAQRKSKDVADKLTYQNGESGKLDQRLEAALSQWQAGLSKTRATAGQMQSLASSVSTFSCSPLQCSPLHA